MSRHHSSIVSLAVFPFLLTAMADTPAPSSLPQVDFSRMGTVGIGGSFAGLDWWTEQSPFASSSSSSTSSPKFSTSGDTVFLRTSSGSYQPLGSTNAGGDIRALCWSNTTDTTNGTLYIGGSFESLSGTPATNIASYSLSSSTFSALSSGLSGGVDALYCDNGHGQVWAGGEFSAPEGTGTGGNVALWSPSSTAWQTISFGGLNGRVFTIDSSPSADSIYFGGRFTTAFASNSSLSLSINGTTSGNITSVPSAPDGTQTTGNSGFLTPVTLPYTGYSDPNDQFGVTAGPTSDQYLYSDPHVVVCPGEGIWLAKDNTASDVSVNGVNYVRANGARIVNGLIQGRGTTGFSILAQPENNQLRLTYTDSKGQNQTCDSNCPLYTDASTGAQDFIFTDGPVSLTGLKVQTTQWQGPGAGLSSVELLTDGSYGSAVSSVNKPLCPGNRPSSSVQKSGDWDTRKVTSPDPYIATYYLTATIPTSQPTYPSVTFFPYTSSSAIYNMYITIPGCQRLGDCDGRTSVDIEVFPVQGGVAYSSTISQQVQQDTKTLVYSGPVDASSDTFTPTVLLSLSKKAAAPAQGSDYVVVADAVELILVGTSLSPNVNATRSSGSAGNGTRTSNTTVTGDSSVAFGLFEYVRSSSASFNAATSVLPNTTETTLSRLGMALDAAYNASSRPSGWAINTIVNSGNTLYVGGDFSVSGNYSNVVSLDLAARQTKPLAMTGLDGTVHAAVVVGNSVYFGGSFTSTASSGTMQLNGLAKWDAGGNSWESLGGGIDGVVAELVVSPSSASQIIVLGNYTTVSAANGSSYETGGYAIWDTSASTWITSGITFGNVTTAASTGSSSGNAFLAGRVTGTSSNAVEGVAMLTTGDGGVPVITTLDNVNFGSSGSAPYIAPSSSPSRRSHASKSAFTRSFLSRFTESFASRSKLQTLVARAPPPTISAASVPAPAVLTGAFWRNSSAGGSPIVTILGGNFTSQNGSPDIEGVAFYTDNVGISGPQPPVAGLVRALNVVGNDVYIGGRGVNVSGIGSGLVVYNLDQRKWIEGGMSPLNPVIGSELIVNTIETRADTNTVVVGGNFQTAGSLSCTGLCLWDIEQAQWSTPGQGLSAGQVVAVDFAGDNSEILVVAGSFSLPNGDVSSVALYSFDNSTWTSLGSLPGPAMAVAVDNKNQSNIFAAGYSTTGNEPYLQRWNGASWTEQNSTLLNGSIVQQLAFVPLSRRHEGSGSIENDRMLMVTGNLLLENTGNVTTALYDGSSMIPYLVGTGSNGALGSGSQLFWSSSSFSFNVIHHLATGLVVLVAIAIATGIILLLVLLFFLIACLNRRRERKKSAPREMFEKDGSPSDIDSTHQHVFNNVQAALEQSLGGAGAGVAGVGAAGAMRNRDERRSDPSFYAAGAAGDNDDEYEDDEDEGRETTMRYDFDGPELQPGEMSMKQGQRVIILDDVQSDEWWYARDPQTGREGVVPATYVW